MPAEQYSRTLRFMDMRKALMLKNIIFDFDSTLTTLEGLDEIAREKKVQTQISKITTLGMNGEISFDVSLKMRLEILHPTKSDFDWLASEYKKNLVLGASELIAELNSQKINVFLVTGGPRPSIEPVAQHLKIKPQNVWAACFSFDKNNQAKIQKSCVMTMSDGKIKTVSRIASSGKTVVVGDGMTDFNASQKADMFIGFGGVVKREAVRSKSKIYVEDPNLMNLLKYIDI